MRPNFFGRIPLFLKIIIEIELIELSKRHTVTGTQLIHPGILLHQVLPSIAFSK